MLLKLPFICRISKILVAEKEENRFHDWSESDRVEQTGYVVVERRRAVGWCSTSIIDLAHLNISHSFHRINSTSRSLIQIFSCSSPSHRHGLQFQPVSCGP